MPYHIGIDAGSSLSGLCVLKDGVPIKGAHIENDAVFSFINTYPKKGLVVVIEDIVPYASKLGASTINTIKFIGEICFRLREAGIKYELLSRPQVKKWVFDNFLEICKEKIDKRIDYLDRYQEKLLKKELEYIASLPPEKAAKYKQKVNINKYRRKDENGNPTELRNASLVFVDDNIVIAAMKKYWGIESKKGLRSKIGLKSHSFQALAVVTLFLETSGGSAVKNRKEVGSESLLLFIPD